MSLKLKMTAVAILSAVFFAGAIFASAQIAITAFHKCADGNLVTNPSACKEAVVTTYHKCANGSLMTNSAACEAVDAVAQHLCADGKLVTNPSVCEAVVVTATTSCFQFTDNLKLGSRGEQVVKLQKFLNARGFLVAGSGAGSPGMESPYFGERTKMALIKWQNANASSVLAP